MFFIVFLGDIQEFRHWLRREVIWHLIVEAGEGIVGTLQKLYKCTFPSSFTMETLDLKRVHYGKLYEEHCDTIKGGLKKTRNKQAHETELAAKRAVYRYVYTPKK